MRDPQYCITVWTPKGTWFLCKYGGTTDDPVRAKTWKTWVETYEYRRSPELLGYRDVRITTIEATESEAWVRKFD